MHSAIYTGVRNPPWLAPSGLSQQVDLGYRRCSHARNQHKSSRSHNEPRSWRDCYQGAFARHRNSSQSLPWALSGVCLTPACWQVSRSVVVRRNDQVYCNAIGFEKLSAASESRITDSENVYVLESGDEVTPQFDKIMPLAPNTVPEINIEPNHGSTTKACFIFGQSRCRELSWRMATKQYFDQIFFLQTPWL